MDKPPYLSLLEKTDAAARQAPAPGSPGEAAALERFRGFFENMTPARVGDSVDAVYAADAWLYDTLVVHHGIAEIRPYFIKTAERAAGVRVQVLDTLRSGPDFYIKWAMEIDWSGFRKGVTTTSYGMSHLRFNRDGMVVLHYDFWDAANGFFEHIPVVGHLIRWIKRKVAH
jgi:hypothetical protein